MRRDLWYVFFAALMIGMISDNPYFLAVSFLLASLLAFLTAIDNKNMASLRWLGVYSFASLTIEFVRELFRITKNAEVIIFPFFIEMISLGASIAAMLSFVWVLYEKHNTDRPNRK